MKDVSATATTLPSTGSRPSFDDVVASDLDPVYRYLVYLTRDRSLAEDLTADTFEKALRLWRRFDPARASSRTWLCQIARTTALDWFRSEQRRRRREESYMRDEDVVEQFGDGLPGPVEQALHRLAPAEREVIALRVLLELDGPSAARVLGISTTACSTRLSRALKRLEEMTGDVDH
jgi:RNA polymerase sigma-70 factor (ECF subfamily)